jgi:hypothetical protein
MSFWPNGMRAAVSLTYDGALRNHLEVVTPALTQRGLRATFYAYPLRLLESPEGWRVAYRQGHEIGNGCLLGACQPDGSLPGWTPEMVALDIDMMETLLLEVFGDGEHSFGYPCGSPRCEGAVDYREAVLAFGLVARSGIDGFNSPLSCDLTYLSCVHSFQFERDELLSIAEMALERGMWAIFAFEGVGEGEHGCDIEAHHALLDWLDKRRDDVWVDPVISIASRLRQTKRCATLR